MSSKWKRLFDPKYRVKQNDYLYETSYTNYTDSELYDLFRPANWYSLGGADSKNQISARLEVLQEIEYRRAKLQGREPSYVDSLQDSSLRGVQFPNGLIEVNVDDSHNPFQVLRTTIHEGDHSFEQFAIDNGIGFDEHTLSMLKAEFPNYIDSSKGYFLYRSQCNEMFTNNDSMNCLIALKNQFMDEPEYHKYIEGELYQYIRFNGDLRNSSDIRTGSQLKQAKEALKHGDISQDEYDNISKNLSTIDYTDSQTQESFHVEKRLHELNKELSETESERQSENQDLYSPISLKDPVQKPDESKTLDKSVQEQTSVPSPDIPSSAENTEHKNESVNKESEVTSENSDINQKHNAENESETSTQIGKGSKIETLDLDEPKESNNISKAREEQNAPSPNNTESNIETLDLDESVESIGKRNPADELTSPSANKNESKIETLDLDEPSESIGRYNPADELTSPANNKPKIETLDLDANELTAPAPESSKSDAEELTSKKENTENNNLRNNEAPDRASDLTDGSTEDESEKQSHNQSNGYTI